MENELTALQLRLEVDRKLLQVNGSQENKHEGTQGGSTHARLRCPVLNPRVDQVDLWFTRFSELAVLADLPEKYWATKVTEFLDSESPKTVFSLTEDQRKSYEVVKNAILTRYNYTPEGNRLRYMS